MFQEGEKMSEGEIRLCAHCKGLGICCTVSGKYACLACLNRAGVPMAEIHDHFLEAEGVLCSACEGKGNIWIGPATVVLAGYGQGVVPSGHLSVIKR
jgi:hypothetical protein